jgi:hypothetical protein
MKKILLGIMISVFTFQNVFANNEIKDYEFIHDSKHPKYITYSKDNIKPIFNNNTVEWYYNSKNQHLSAFYEEDIINSFKNAMNSWSNISGINFIYKGITDNNINSTNDKIITVGFWSESAFIREFDNIPGYTRIWWSGDKEIYEGYIVLNAGNDGGSNEPTTLNDLEGLITHEIGHLLGIDHSDVEESIMYSNPYHSYNYQRTLRQDDIEIANLLYPSNVLAFGHDAACGTLGDEDLILTLPCVSTSDGRTWSATLHPVPSPDPNDPYISTWTLVDGSIKRASFDPGNNNCASYNAGGSLAVPCGLYLGIRNILQFEANLPVFELKSLYPDPTDDVDSLGPYKIGDIGPAGGVVIYIGDDRSSGLEAAPTDAGTSRWGCVTRAVTDNGTGKSNTDAIIANKCGEYNAAKLARNYIWPNGQRDGFLPNKDELNHLYGQMDVVGGFANGFYWSSTERNNRNIHLHAWVQLFNDGNTFGGRTYLAGIFINNGIQDYSSKTKSHLVRAVRAF